MFQMNCLGEKIFQKISGKFQKFQKIFKNSENFRGMSLHSNSASNMSFERARRAESDDTKIKPVSQL